MHLRLCQCFLSTLVFETGAGIGTLAIIVHCFTRVQYFIVKALLTREFERFLMWMMWVDDSISSQNENHKPSMDIDG